MHSLFAAVSTSWSSSDEWLHLVTTICAAHNKADTVRETDSASVRSARSYALEIGLIVDQRQSCAKILCETCAAAVRRERLLYVLSVFPMSVFFKLQRSKIASASFFLCGLSIVGTYSKHLLRLKAISDIGFEHELVEV